MNKQLIGFSKDIHCLTIKKDKQLVLAGVPFLNEPYVIQSYSDGDIIFHAIADAILSAIGENDIGFYFKDTSFENKGLNSIEIVKFACEQMDLKGYYVSQIDLTIVCEHINIQSKKEVILQSLKNLFKIDFINIKGRRQEDKRNKKIECYAFVVLVKKESI